MRVILASASPRRKEILERHGLSPAVIPADVDESLPGEVAASGPEAIVKYLARIKAEAVFGRLQKESAGEYEPFLLIAADTIVYRDRVFGKPGDGDEAFAILSALRGGAHFVFTGVALIRSDTGGRLDFCERAKVTFKDYPDEEIWRFIHEEKPFDKAGSYAIQSSWSRNVSSIEGDIENVIGLPWARLEKELILFSD